MKDQGKDKGLRLIDIIDSLSKGEDIYLKHVKTVRDLMSDELIKVTLDDKLEHAWDIFEKHGIHHIPVIDPDDDKGTEFFVGLVSQHEISRQISPGAGTVVASASDEKIFKEPVGSIVTRNPLTAKPEDTIFKVAETMLNEKISSLPVLAGENKLVGLITSQDIVKIFYHIKLLEKLSQKKQTGRLIDLAGGGTPDAAFIINKYFGSIREIMTVDIQSLRPDDTLEKAIDIMQSQRVRHVPIIDGVKGLIGVVSDLDIARSLPPKSSNFYKNPKKEEKFLEDLFTIDKNDKVLKTELRFVMTSIANFTKMYPDSSLNDCIEAIMKQTNTRFLPVVEEQEAKIELLGIITIGDLLRAVSLLGMLVGNSLQGGLGAGGMRAMR